MKNRDSYLSDPKDETSGERVESLLHAAAAFTPEHDAPDDIVSKALARSGVAARATRRPAFAVAAGSALVAACALAAAALVVAHPAKGPGVAVVRSRPPIIARAEPKPVQAVGKQPQTITPKLVAAVLPIHGPHGRRRLRLGHSAIAARRTAPRRIPPLKTLALPPRQAIAANTTAAPARSGWTTEDVQETSYMLVSPGVVTEGSGNSETATPVMVSLPINPDGSGAVDAYKADPADPDAH